MSMPPAAPGQNNPQGYWAPHGQPNPPQSPPYPPHGQPYAPPPYGGPPPRKPRRRALPWVIAGIVLVVLAGVVLTLVLVLGGDDEQTPGVAEGVDGTQYDLSTPVEAAKSFSAAAQAGDTATFLKLTCVGVPACVTKYAPPDATPRELDSAKQQIVSGIAKFAEQTRGATFEEPQEASGEADVEVPYRTPSMSPDEFHAMAFVKFNGSYLFFGSSGGVSGGGPSAGGGGAAGGGS